MKIIVCFVVMALLSCTRQSVGEGESSLWIKAFDNKVELSSFYTDNAYRITPTGEYIQHGDSIVNKNSRQFSSPENLEITCSVSVAYDKYFYEIGHFSDNGNSDHHFLIIRDSSHKRLLELFVPKQKFTPDLEQIAKQRLRWMQLCNNHQVEDLVDELYVQQPLYYNFKPLIEGSENIINTYSYMNNEWYNLQLHPICINQLSNEIAFEIGQCSGSYVGKYILVWKKGSDGRWRILLDVNK